MIELILPVYKRVHRLSEIIDDLNNQTMKWFRLNIWNNSGKKLEVKGNKFPLQVIESKEGNIGSGARFKLLTYTKGTPIISFDDDEKLFPDFVEYHYNQYKKWGEKYIAGWYSKLLSKDIYKNEIIFQLPYGQEVDYLGTGGLVMSSKIAKIIPNLTNLPKEFMMAEDIYLSARARQFGLKLVSILPKCEIINDSFNSNKRFSNDKQKVFEKLRQEGWKLLCEGYESE